MNQPLLHHLTVHGLGFTTDFLLQLSDRAQTSKLEHTRPESYDLPPKTTLEEAIQDAWDDARKHWKKHQDHQTDVWTGWLRPLLKILDYSLISAPTGTKFAVRYQTETGEIPVHFSLFDLDPVNTETGSRISPHGILQGHLNTTPNQLWGLVCNTEKLRLLRDNAQMTRAAYLEFDLSEIMKTEDTKAFRVLWLLLHRSRFKNAQQSILENWNSRANEEGVKARDDLRDQVKTAIEHLGTGFLQHNPEIHAQVKTSNAELSNLYRECLKLIYQMVFLFVTEDRDLLFAKKSDNTYTASAETRERAKHYLTRSIRTKASRTKGNPLHTDAYMGWQTLIGHLRGGFAPLGLPALGSHLFAPNRLSALKLPNNFFYSAIHALSEISTDNTRRPVNYAGLDSEELGSIYESLLELVPSIEPGGRLTLETLAGNERKTTGSYYTPSSLIQLLLESALDPVIQEATKNKTTPEAILALKNLKIIDPACGSGHFLIAAARRIGAKLAELEEDTSIPSPSALRRATRTIIAHCIYGADINPMAIELAKVALWLEAQDAGKPLAFLDHRLRVGNSLLGTSPELMFAPDSITERSKTNKNDVITTTRTTLHLPNEAFAAIEGDDKPTVAALKKSNTKEREHYVELAINATMFDFAQTNTNAIFAAYKELDAIEPDSLEEVKRQEAKFDEILQKTELQQSKLLADAWCAAFVTPKTPDSLKITTTILNQLLQKPSAPELEPIRDLVQSTAKQYQFLHPHIEFADVFTATQKGFDCVLGNPPWEAPEENKENSVLENRIIYGLQHFVNNSNRFELTSGGKNLYLFFTELSTNLLKESGNLGIIVQTEIIQSKPAERISSYLVKSKILKSLYDFENKKVWFPAIDSRLRFSLISISRTNTKNSQFVFDITSLDEIKQPERIIDLSYEIFSNASPSRFSIPAFKNSKSAKLFLTMAARLPMMASDNSSLSGTLMFNFEASDKAIKMQSNGTQIENTYNTYDGENIHQFEFQRKGSNEADAPFVTEFLMPKPFVNEKLTKLFDCIPTWILVLRRQARGNDSFVGISAIIPTAAVEGSLSVIKIKNNSPVLAATTVANFNSFCFNYLVALRISGPNVNKGVYEQIPIVFNNETRILSSVIPFIIPRVLELTCTAHDLNGFATDLGYTQQPFTWNTERRFWLRAELDALYFLLYGIARADVEYIMDTFPIVRRKDETAFGEYRTKNAILEIFDALQGLGLERLLEYQSRVENVAGGWKP